MVQWLKYNFHCQLLCINRNSSISVKRYSLKVVQSYSIMFFLHEMDKLTVVNNVLMSIRWLNKIERPLELHIIKSAFPFFELSNHFLSTAAVIKNGLCMFVRDCPYLAFIFFMITLAVLKKSGCFRTEFELNLQECIAGWKTGCALLSIGPEWSVETKNVDDLCYSPKTSSSG